MTSPAYRTFRPLLAEVNNQLWYAYLADAQAYPEFERASLANPDGLTTQAFSENPIVARICVKNKELPTFRARSIAAMAGIAFVSSTEHTLRYIKDVQAFREELSLSNVQATKDASVEEILSNRVLAWGQKLDPLLIRSIAYLRLRRNQVAHANEEPSAAFISFVRHNGTSLNQYWAGKPAKLPELDFAKPDGKSFTQAESISLLNLCKICITAIDEVILRSIPSNVLEDRAIATFTTENRHLNGSSVDRRFRKFKRHFEAEFGLPLKCDVDGFKAALEKLLVRVD